MAPNRSNMPIGNVYRGVYNVENKSKFIGDKDPTYRSSWESRFMYFLDHKVEVVKWGYECLEIQYFSVIDKKVHRYYPDFYFEMVDKDNINKKYVIEVKPEEQTRPPKQPKNNNQKASKRFIYEAHEFVKNQCKWEAAKEYCRKKGYEFKIITENELFTR